MIVITTVNMVVFFGVQPTLNSQASFIKLFIILCHNNFLCFYIKKFIS